MGPPRRVRWFVWAVVVLALATTASAFFRGSFPPSGRDLFAALLLAVVTALARFLPVQLAPRTQVTVDSAAAFVSVLLLPPYLAVTAVGLGLGVASLVRPSIFIQQAFNVAMGVLAVAVGALIVDRFLPVPIDEASDLDLLKGVLPAALAMWSVNTLLVDAVIALQQRRRLFERWWPTHRLGIWQEISLYLIGLLILVSPVEHTWALALVIVPSAVVYRSLRDGVALKFQTRRALEELADVVDLRDRYTHAHCRRVGEMSQLLARRLGFEPEEVERIYLAARVHDVGKIGIKSTVLLKPGDLSEPEWLEMRSHPEVGARIIEKFPEFTHGKELVLSHHERWDGDGYPRGLAGTEIPAGARVIAVADAWDAMVSHRAYRRAMDLELAFAEMERGRGSQFEPRVLDAFLLLLKERPELAVQHTEIIQEVDIAEEQCSAG